jgi:hypothetical protein
MPIEVRELVIKAVVEQENSSGAGGMSNASNSNTVSSSEEMIKMCVEKVLEILKERDGR